MNFDFLWQSIKLSAATTVMFVMFAVWVGAIYRTAFGASSMNFTPWYLRIWPLIGSWVFFVVIEAGRYREQIALQMFAVCTLIYFQQCTTHLFLLTRNKNRIVDADEAAKLQARSRYYHAGRDLLCGLLTGAMTASHYLDDGIFPIVVTAALVLFYDAYVEFRYGRVRAGGETDNAIVRKLFCSVAIISVGFAVASIVSTLYAEEPTLFMNIVGIAMVLLLIISRVFTIDQIETDYFIA